MKKQTLLIISIINCLLAPSSVQAQRMLFSETVVADGIRYEKTHQRAVRESHPDENVTLLDFGNDAFSQLYLLLGNSNDGDTLHIHLGECLKNGRIDRNPGEARRYRRLETVTRKACKRYDIDIPHDRRNTRKPAILIPEEVGEVLPFRYCEVESPRNSKIKIGKKNVVRVAVNVPFDDTSSYFRCDNDNLNRVWELCKHSIKATTFTGYYVDGDRERIPYEADALINQLCHYGVDNEYDVARRTFEHLLKNPTWPSEWIMQMNLIAWYDLLFTGNKELIMKHQTELRSHTLLDLVDDKTGLVTTRRGQSKDFLTSIARRDKISDIVDWPHSGILGLSKGQGGEDDGYVYTDFNTVVNAYHYIAVRKYAEMLAEIGNTEESEEYHRYCDRFKVLFNNAFFDETRGYYRDGTDTDHASLHGNMFPMVFGLVPSSNMKSVADFIVSRGMSCSVYGAQFLLDALYDCNRGDIALQLMTNESKRGWINMMREGSTITMEAWGNEFKPNQDWNHAWGAAPANIIPFRLMGVRPTSSGCSEIDIFPQTANLRRAEILVPTVKGGVKVNVRRKDDAYVIEVNVPKEIKALVRLLPEIAEKGTAYIDGKPIELTKTPSSHNIPHRLSGRHVIKVKGEFRY